MITHMQHTVAQSGADYADVRWETASSMTVAMVNGKVDNVVQHRREGGHARALTRGGQAFHAFIEPEDMNNALEAAQRAAELVASHTSLPVRLAPVAPVQAKVTLAPASDPRSVSFDDKLDLLRHYHEAVKDLPNIVNVSFVYGEHLSSRLYANSEGTVIDEEQLYCDIRGTFVAKDGALVERVGVRIGCSDDYSRLLNRENVFLDKARIASALLRAQPVRGGVYHVILDPVVAGVFIHEAFGHLSESDTLVFNKPMRDRMELGSRFGQPFLNVADQGNIPGLSGTYYYDEEGVPTRKTYLIKDGILSGRLHSRASAAFFGEPVTGNYRARDFTFNPLVRQSNIFVEQGETPFADMASDIRNGLYLVTHKGGQTIGDLFTFGAQYGYEITNGKIGALVKDINMSGNVFETLMNIDAVGNDLVHAESGGCGKTGFGAMQMLNKSGFGSPHIRVAGIVIGGK